MRKILFTLSSLIFFLTLTFVINSNNAKAAINNKPGDLIITKDTAPGSSGKGFVGHVGIYIDSKKILNASGRSNEPYPSILTEKQWHNRFKYSKVVRPKSTELGKKAAKMAKKYFLNKKIKYKISPNPKNIKYTYCSELVWYSYYKAGKPFQVLIVTPHNEQWANPSLIKPYDYLSSYYLSHNGFKIIDNKW